MNGATARLPPPLICATARQNHCEARKQGHTVNPSNSNGVLQPVCTPTPNPEIHRGRGNRRRLRARLRDDDALKTTHRKAGAMKDLSTSRSRACCSGTISGGGPARRPDIVWAARRKQAIRNQGGVIGTETGIKCFERWVEWYSALSSTQHRCSAVRRFPALRLCSGRAGIPNARHAHRNGRRDRRTSLSRRAAPARVRNRERIFQAHP